MITTLNEFTEIIEGDYKIKDLPSYVEYKYDRKDGISQSEIDRLSPDAIRSSSFWEWIEKNPELAKDAIGFGMTSDKSIQELNYYNLRLAMSMGTMIYVSMCSGDKNMPILDIGAGYGMLKDYVEKATQLAYYGVDVYPKIPGVLALADGDSTLPDAILNMKFGLVVSTNVFQHLSVKQRRNYYEQVAKILIPNGVFSVSMSAAGLDECGAKGFVCKETGKEYMCHYGQYTEVQTEKEIMDDLRKHFQVLSVLRRLHDNSIAFHCTPKPTTIDPITVNH